MIAQRKQLIAETAALPHDEFAEQIVLGALLNDREGGLYERVAATLDESMFYLRRHQLAFRGLGALARKGISPNYHTLIHELESSGDQDELIREGGASRLLEVPEIEGLASYCETVAETARQRQLYMHFKGLADRALLGDASAELTESARTAISAVESSGTLPSTAMNPAQIIEEAGGINAFAFPETERGIMTPFTRLNVVTSGLGRGEVMVVAARTGVGKSSFACNVAVHAAANQNHVLFISLEMKKRKLLYRMACGIAEVDSMLARLGKLSMKERLRFQDAVQQVNDLEDYLLIDDHPHATTLSVAGLLRKRRAEGKTVRLVILDHLLLMKGLGRFRTKLEELNQITRDVKLLSNEFDTHVMELTQISRAYEHRGGELKNAQPQLSDLKEAGSIEENSDSVLMFGLDDPKQFAVPVREVTGYLLKHREGATGKIEFKFHAVYTKFVEQPKQPREGIAA